MRPTRAEIDLAALRANLAAVRALAPKADVLAVVKANAYGHGAVQVARALETTDVRILGVALVEEGLELRSAGVTRPILVLGGAYEGGYDVMVQYDLWPTVFRPEHITGYAAAARRAGRRQVMAHLKVDTGMGRIGVLPDEMEGFLAFAAKYPEVKLDGLLSHFANADLADADLTSRQIARFKEALAVMRRHGIDPSFRHLSNSAGVLDRPEVRDGLELNLVRPGIMLYGLTPASWLSSRAPLRPVLSWRTAITHLKTVPRGTPISYGSTWTAPRESVIATLPVGYADGYARSFSNRADVLVRGRRAKIAGRVCMDMMMVDVTDVPGVSMGDEVILIGAQGNERITADELAALSGTIHYEVLCAVAARVPRVVSDVATI
ncbi:MAG: alanine racemase [Myxococcaceae bacterium]|nr:alanine racemase [Myxococcaceae bacterium]